MKFSKRLALAAATVGLSACSVVPAFAATQNSPVDGQADPRTSLIQALVQRFHLNQSELETFFSQQEAQHIQERSAQVQSHLEQRLTAAVSNGRLTEAQKSALLAKAKEAQAKHEEARKLSREECKKMMDAYRSELEAWLTSQGIDKSYVRDLMGPGPGRHPAGLRGGFGGRMGDGRFGGPMRGEGQGRQGPQN